MGMFSQIRNSVNSILPRLYEDEDLVTPITWKKFVSAQWNDSLGYDEETFVEYSIDAIKLKKGLSSGSGARPSGLTMSIGDVIYLFRHEDLPDGISTRDIIIEDGKTYSVEKIYPVFGLVVEVEVKGYD